MIEYALVFKKAVVLNFFEEFQALLKLESYKVNEALVSGDRVNWRLKKEGLGFFFPSDIDIF